MKHQELVLHEIDGVSVKHLAILVTRYFVLKIVQKLGFTSELTLDLATALLRDHT